jgi:hypothetical protein
MTAAVAHFSPTSLVTGEGGRDAKNSETRVGTRLYMPGVARRRPVQLTTCCS